MLVIPWHERKKNVLKFFAVGKLSYISRNYPINPYQKLTFHAKMKIFDIFILLQDPSEHVCIIIGS